MSPKGAYMITFPKTKKLKLLSVVLLIITAWWTLFIFNFSTQNAETSSKVSVGLLKTILLYIQDFLWFEVDFIALHHFFRTLAHFVEFFILGLLSTSFLKTLRASSLFSTLYCLIVAVTDETIQHFTGSGRAAQLKDIITDFMGSLLAIVLFIIAEILIKKIRIKSNKNEHTAK